MDINLDVGGRKVSRVTLATIKAKAMNRAVGYFTSELMNNVLTEEELTTTSISGEALSFQKSSKKKLDENLTDSICTVVKNEFCLTDDSIIRRFIRTKLNNSASRLGKPKRGKQDEPEETNEDEPDQPTVRIIPERAKKPRIRKTQDKPEKENQEDKADQPKVRKIQKEANTPRIRKNQQKAGTSKPKIVKKQVEKSRKAPAGEVEKTKGMTLRNR